MTDPRVAVLGNPADPHVAAVVAAIERAGGRPIPIATRPADTATWVWTEAGICTAEGRELLSVDAAYIRSLGVSLPDDVAAVDHHRRAYARVKAAHAALCDVVQTVVNPVDAYWFHRSKPAADAAIAAAGITVADSLATADPNELFVFAQHHREIVYKPVAGGGACRALTSSDITPAGLAALAESPVYFQERIRGDDLRVYVLDGEVIGAAHIVTSALDYRGNEEAVVALGHDDELGRIACGAADALGLVFSGVDVKRRPDGSLAVLDVNPSPMFLGFEQRAGLTITAALAAHLVRQGR